MSGLIVQFYAQTEELSSFSVEIVSDFDLYVVGMHFPPYRANMIEHSRLSDSFKESDGVYEIAFTLDPPVLPAKGNMEFVDKNPDQLSLMIGRQTKHGLEESTLSCRTNNSKAFAIWKKVAYRLKKMTKAGITVVNRESGERGFYKTCRYSEGAKALEGSGVAMVSPSGPNGPKILLGRREYSD